MRRKPACTIGHVEQDGNSADPKTQRGGTRGQEPLWNQARYARLIRALWSSHFLLSVEVWAHKIKQQVSSRFSINWMTEWLWQQMRSTRFVNPCRNNNRIFDKGNQRVISPHHQWSWQHQAAAKEITAPPISSTLSKIQWIYLYSQ